MTFLIQVRSFPDQFRRVGIGFRGKEKHVDAVALKPPVGQRDLRHRVILPDDVEDIPVIPGFSGGSRRRETVGIYILISAGIRAVGRCDIGDRGAAAVAGNPQFERSFRRMLLQIRVQRGFHGMRGLSESL